MSLIDFEQQRLDRLKLIIVAHEDAILALLTAGGVQEYTIDTGQGRQTVKRADVSRLQETWGLLIQQYDAMVARCNGGGAVQVTPWRTAPWVC